MSKEVKPKVELTTAQQLAILKAWNDAPKNNPPSLKELTHLVFNDKTDPRSREGRAVRDYLASRQLNYQVQEEMRVLKPEFTDEMREYMANHCAAMTYVEMTRELWKDPSITNLDIRTRAVREYVLSLPDVVKKLDAKIEDIETDETGLYRPPKSKPQALARLNKYMRDAFTPEDLATNTKLQMQMESLIRNLHLNRFNLMINNYGNPIDKNLFEDTFVRSTYDKENLSEEELDAYITYCCDVVSHTRLQRRLEELDEVTQGLINGTEEDKKLSMSLVELMKTVRQELNDNVKRQQKTMNDLNGKRTERVNARMQQNASVIQLVEAWREEDKRKTLIKIAEARKKNLSDEIKKLENLDEVKTQWFGMNKDGF